jgi:hypothetical protein
MPVGRTAIPIFDFRVVHDRGARPIIAFLDEPLPA